MGQVECLNIMSKEKWESTSEIAEKLGQRCSIVSRSLSKIFSQCLIFKKSVVEEGHRLTRWKKR